MSIYVYYNYYSANYTYYKPSLVKVMEVRVCHPVFCPYILHKLEPRA
jgi:hypothetical protein